MKKKITAVFAACVMLLSGVCHAADGVKIIIDSTPLELDVEAYIENERTMVPLRGVFEAVGAQVGWDDETKTAVVSKTDGSDVTFILLQIGLDKAFINSEQKPLDAPAVIKDGRTMVPLRFVMEELGVKSVDWNGAERTAEIVTE